jgi:hypothetical protein
MVAILAILEILAILAMPIRHNFGSAALLGRAFSPVID